MEQLRNDIDRRKTKVLGEKPVSMPLDPPQISSALWLGLKPDLRGERSAINLLNQDMSL